MEQFIKERIAFSLALLAVVLALHPFIKDNPDIGFTILNIPFLIRHFYWAFALFLGTAVYFYAVQFLKVGWLSFTEKIGTACFLFALITPVAYIMVYAFHNLALLVGKLAQQQWLNTALSISSIFMSVVSSAVGYFFGQKSLNRLKNKEKISRATQKGMSFIETAKKMISVGLYGPSLIQLFSSIMLSIRKSLFAEQAENQKMPDMKILELATKKKILSLNIIDQIHELRKIRNRLAHPHEDQEIKILREQAKKYLDLSITIMDKLETQKFVAGSPCEMSGQECPGCNEGLMNVAPGEEGVVCNRCGLYIPA